MRCMKRFVCILAAMLVVLTGCAESIPSVRLRSFDMVSITPTGLTSFTVQAKVTLDNPSRGFRASEISGLVRSGENPCVKITAEDVAVPGKCTGEQLEMRFHGEIAPGFSVFQILGSLRSMSLDSFVADASARISLGKGNGKVVERKNIPLKKILAR